VLQIVEDVVGVGDLDEFRLALLRALMRVVPSDWASPNDVLHRARPLLISAFRVAIECEHDCPCATCWPPYPS
jgi:hypothetical protein